MLTIRLIDGHLAEKRRCIARCHLDTHPGYLSKTMVKTHRCLEKQCPFLEKIPHEYWETRAQLEAEKAEHRKRVKAAIASKKERNAYIRSYLEERHPIYVTVIEDMSKGLLKITFLSSNHIDLEEEEIHLKELCKKALYFHSVGKKQRYIDALIAKRQEN